MSDENPFKQWVKKDGSTKYKPEKDRYVLLHSFVCPFAHKAVSTLYFLGLDEIIDVITLHPLMYKTKLDDESDDHYGWVFKKYVEELENKEQSKKDLDDFPNVMNDPFFNSSTLRDFYDEFKDLNYKGRYTVPVLFDKKTKTIVNNESSDIMRMFEVEFVDFHKNKINLYPDNLSKQIDEMNETIDKKLMFPVNYLYLYKKKIIIRN